MRASPELANLFSKLEGTFERITGSLQLIGGYEYGHKALLRFSKALNQVVLLVDDSGALEMLASLD
jgi:hypothetical protein